MHERRSHNGVEGSATATAAHGATAIVGAASALGRALTERACHARGGTRVLCLDRSAPPQYDDGVLFEPLEDAPSRHIPRLRQLGVQRAVYVAPGVGDAGCATGTAQQARTDLLAWLGSFEAAGIRRIVVVHGAGAVTTSPARAEGGPVAEGAALQDSAGPDRARETVVAEFARAHPETVLTLCRVPHLAGGGARGLASALSSATRIAVPVEAAARWQFVHVDDAAAALQRLLDSALAGVYHVAADGALTLEQAAAVLRRQVVRYTPGAWRLLRAARWLSRGALGTALDPAIAQHATECRWLDNRKIQRDTSLAFVHDSATALAAHDRDG